MPAGEYRGGAVYTHGGEPAGLDVVEWAQEVAELGRRDSSNVDGCRRHSGRLRHSALDARRLKGSADPGDCVGRRRARPYLYDGSTEGYADAVLVATIFHYGQYRVRQAKEYLSHRGIPVRI